MTFIVATYDAMYNLNPAAIVHGGCSWRYALHGRWWISFVAV